MIFKLPRKRWVVVLAVLATALAVAVPVAWATFNDVGPEDPFYNDVNAIQGAGITSGCGGGNFCPSSNITREAEAAFVHRNAPRVAWTSGGGGQLDPGGSDLGSVTITVGGVAGGTQFVVLSASVNTWIFDTEGCPCDTGYQFTDDAGNPVSDAAGYNLNDTVTADNGEGDDTGSVQAVVPVSTGTTYTYHVRTFNQGGTGTVFGTAQITAMTVPFGSGGGNTLNAEGTQRSTPGFSHPKK
jgi:hypothetical protein